MYPEAWVTSKIWQSICGTTISVELILPCVQTRAGTRVTSACSSATESCAQLARMRSMDVPRRMGLAKHARKTNTTVAPCAVVAPECLCSRWRQQLYSFLLSPQWHRCFSKDAIPICAIMQFNLQYDIYELFIQYTYIYNYQNRELTVNILLIFPRKDWCSYLVSINLSIFNLFFV